MLSIIRLHAEWNSHAVNISPKIESTRRSGFRRSVASGGYFERWPVGRVANYDRTMNVIALIDCAFSFYSNFPCRLAPSELECDLPCEESVFNCEHPFAQLKFRFTRETTICGAFQHLFDDEPETTNCQHGPNHSNYCQHTPSIGTSFTVTDMFLMIHSTLHGHFQNRNMLCLPSYLSSLLVHQFTHDRPSTHNPYSTAQKTKRPVDNYLSIKAFAPHSVGGVLCGLT